jgi:hypothetical protein
MNFPLFLKETRWFSVFQTLDRNAKTIGFEAFFTIIPIIIGLC